MNWKPLYSLILLLLLLMVTTLTLVAQPLLTQEFKFQSGVFLTYKEFQSNQPRYSGDDIKAAYFMNPQTEEVRVEYIRLKETEAYLNVDSIWGISIKGIPYVKVKPNKRGKSLSTFAKMEVRGNICYYYYNDVEQRRIPFSAYNPYTQQPYRTMVVSRDIPIVVEKILRFETGEVTDFNYQNVLEWIGKDTDLGKAILSMGPQESEKGLFRSLLLYDDKHEVRLKTWTPSTN